MGCNFWRREEFLEYHRKVSRQDMEHLFGLASQHSGQLDLPTWSVLPFVGLLLTLGVMSFISANLPHSLPAQIWESNTNKLVIALLWCIPVILLLGSVNAWEALLVSLEEYFAFLVLLFSLFVISGGIYLEGDLRATPLVNSAFLAIGAVAANLVGTTGASVLLIRPMLKTNSERQRTAHIPVFFIFLVSNIGGCLLPIGDPPLFLGFLEGVPFFWTLRLFPQWLTAVLLVLGIFFVFDTLQYKRESDYARKLDMMEYRPLRIRGGINFLLLAGVVVTVGVITPALLASWGIHGGPLSFMREYVLLALSGLSLVITPLSSEPRQENNFTFGPIQEVAYLFLGIFIAMVPALTILRLHGADLGLSHSWHFFWATGALSSVLDNAPTYLTFASVAQGLASAHPGVYTNLLQMTRGSVPQELLAAISAGSVFMGANTYIGNGPNFMVKAIAEEWGYRTPDFFTYIVKYSLPILIPVFIVITFIFFL